MFDQCVLDFRWASSWVPAGAPPPRTPRGISMGPGISMCSMDFKESRGFLLSPWISMDSVEVQEFLGFLRIPQISMISGISKNSLSISMDSTDSHAFPDCIPHPSDETCMPNTSCLSVTWKNKDRFRRYTSEEIPNLSQVEAIAVWPYPCVVCFSTKSLAQRRMSARVRDHHELKGNSWWS